MAKCEVTFPTDLERQLRRMADTNVVERIVGKALRAGGMKILAETRVRLHAVLSKSERATGELEASLGLTKPEHGADGWNVKVGFNEPRRVQHAPKVMKQNGKPKRSYYTETNAMIANVLEYGKSGQSARPFLRPAERATEEEAQAEVVRVIEEEMSKL